MSTIYISEPPTHGKVVLHTTVGDLDIELWSKETPKACRNFVQLCMEKYYDGTIFHRVIKDFIAQGGDPNGDGTGGESIYGKPFEDEFHSRLRFNRRGLVAMANAGSNDNGSQFFFTLGPCTELQKKHTIFGKLAGDTVFNMLKLEDCIVDKDDRPSYPHKIISCEVLSNPFPDIVPRVSVKSAEVVEPEQKTKNNAAKVKDYKLLSFGEEAEEEEMEADAAAESFRGKSKSSHDLANDPKLSSVSVSSLYNVETSPENDGMLESIRKKLKTESSNLVEEKTATVEEPEKSIEKKIKKDFKKKPVAETVKISRGEIEKKNHKEENPLLEEYHQQAEFYAKQRSRIPSDKETREQQTLALLSKFQNKLQSLKDFSNDLTDDNHDEEVSDAWMIKPLSFEQDIVVAKDANLPSEDRYDITDPRNPITQRRHQKKKT